MSLFARFQIINDNHKRSVVRVLIENSTPDFDFFYLAGLATMMAALGLLADSPAIVIGSMLMAPLLYPVLGIALGLVMSDQKVLGRSLLTLSKSFLVGITLSVLAALFFGGDVLLTSEVLARTEPHLVYFMVAVVAGLGVTYALAHPEWNATLPGIAISVALLPPLAVVGIGIAALEIAVVSGALVLLGINIAGIIFAAMITFSLMNLYEKRDIAESTIKKEEERIEEENEAIEEVKNGNGVPQNDKNESQV